MSVKQCPVATYRQDSEILRDLFAVGHHQRELLPIFYLLLIYLNGIYGDMIQNKPMQHGQQKVVPATWPFLQTNDPPHEIKEMEVITSAPS